MQLPGEVDPPLRHPSPAFDISVIHLDELTWLTLPRNPRRIVMPPARSFPPTPGAFDMRRPALPRRAASSRSIFSSWNSRPPNQTRTAQHLFTGQIANPLSILVEDVDGSVHVSDHEISVDHRLGGRIERGRPATPYTSPLRLAPPYTRGRGRNSTSSQPPQPQALHGRGGGDRAAESNADNPPLSLSCRLVFTVTGPSENRGRETPSGSQASRGRATAPRSRLHTG